jgi:ABC-type nitrate/sulfonate/bicarbonate transport system permease component
MRSRTPALLYTFSLIAGLAIWEIYARTLPNIVLAPPSAVISSLVQGFFSGEIARALAGSLGALLLGYALAVIIGVPLGFLIGRSKRASEMAEPVMNAIYAIPPVAFVPFLIIWFGLFFQARIALIFLMAIFEIVVTVAAGAANLEPSLLNVGRSFGASRAKMLRSVVMPASLPFIFAGLRLGLVRAINGMITAELFFAAVNLGKIMKDAASRFDTAGLLAIILLLCLLGLLAQEGLKWLEGRLMPWYIRRS